MAIAVRWILTRLILLFSAVSLLADSAESRAFNAAAEAFRGAFYQRADNEFGAFLGKYPNSPRAPEALLLRAQARLQSTNYSGAIELLQAGRDSAGPWADQYLFWIAQAFLRQGDIKSAAENFAALRSEHPSSARRLEATISEAAARAQLQEWPRVVEILGGTNGVLGGASLNKTNALAQQGFLLLARAQFAEGSPAAAEAALENLAGTTLDPGLDWQQQSLLVELRSASGQLDQALAACTNLLRLAANASNASWKSQSASTHAALLAQAGRMDEAFVIWQQNLAPGVPPTFQREALAKTAEMAIARGKPAEAIAVLERFLSQEKEGSVSETALLLLAEMRLREYATRQVGGEAPAKAALLEEATAALKSFVEKFPSNPLIGKAQLNLGWCLWLKGDLQNSQAAFKAASEALPSGLDQATALFKLADVQLQLGNYPEAITNYTAVVDRYGEMPGARTNFIERALYQTIRAAIPAGNRAAATQALGRMLRWFPRGPLAERAVLLGGVEVSRYDPAEARRIYEDFIKAFPGAQLLPEVQLAIARSYEQQNQWTNAIAQYDEWIASHTNHPAVERAQYSRAWANFQAGRDTNAFSLFTNFVAQFPQSEFHLSAQWWIGDFFFRSGQPESAERTFKSIFQSTNRPVSELAYQARMMAGRAAFARQSATDAAGYFTALWNDANCPTELRAQALFAYGDTLMTMDSGETNRVANYDEAIRVFNRLIEMFPTNKLAVLAQGQKASCLMQWAQVSQQYDAASNGFHQVLVSPLSDAKARSIAKLGLATILERQAQQNSASAGALQKAALNHCLDVFFGHENVIREGEQADPFWTRRAGLEAARLAELQGEWVHAIRIYQRLQELLPVMRPRTEKGILRAQEQLAKTTAVAGKK
jgi:TolA-binding protein